MGKEPDEIREAIEETRGQMSGTVEAIGEKFDIPARVKHSINETKESVLHSFTGTREKVMHSASTQMDDTAQELREQGGRLQRMATENPLGLAVGSAALGFLAGMLVPSTHFESENIGPAASQVTDTLVETGKEAIERGKSVAEDTMRAATDTAKERAQEELHDMQEEGTADVQAPKQQWGSGRM